MWFNVCWEKRSRLSLRESSVGARPLFSLSERRLSTADTTRKKNQVTQTEREVDLQELSIHLQELESLIEAEQFVKASELLDRVDSSERTMVLARLPEAARQTLIKNTDLLHAASFLHDLPEAHAVETVGSLNPAKAALILDELPKSEQADLVGELSTRDRESIYSAMENQTAEEIRQLTEYDDEEAGGMMIVQFVSVSATDTLEQVIHKLQLNSNKYTGFSVQYIYVVDENEKLIGVLPLRKLVLSERNVTAAEAMVSGMQTFHVKDRLVDLHEFFTSHRFVGVPGVDDDGRLVGVLRRGDVEEAMAEHYSDDYMKAQGIIDEELRTMPLMKRSSRRLAWLSINIFLNLFAAGVIAYYQETLAQVIALAVFLPIISDMSGCSGNQAVAVSMRELSLGLVDAREAMRVWMKEIGVGLINGFALGLFIGLLAWLWKGNPWLGIVVGCAMMFNTIIAVSLGGTLPLVMRRFGLDPALASGPILTTVTDMCGFFIVLSCASMILDRLV